jgi:hypothetical protein
MVTSQVRHIVSLFHCSLVHRSASANLSAFAFEPRSPILGALRVARPNLDLLLRYAFQLIYLLLLVAHSRLVNN